jgi:hypothetical protein
MAMKRSRIFTATAAGLLLAACSADSPITAPGANPGAAPRFSGSSAVTGAAFTTTNPEMDRQWDGKGAPPTTPVLCRNGQDPQTGTNNCNIYSSKKYVWLNGGPVAAGLESGTYFWAVLAPGGQPTPNDGGVKNLSDDTDPYTNRRFTWDKASQTFTYLPDPAATGTQRHDVGGTRVRVGAQTPMVAGGPPWFADTPNPGGVYILAICKINAPNSYPVSPRDCKYDAFKIQEADGGEKFEAPTIYKDAAGAYKNTYTWTITKSVDKTTVTKVMGSADFNYTVVVKRDGGTISDIKVTGKITALNANSRPITGVKITDELSVAGSDCSVIGGDDVSLEPGSTEFQYTCTIPGSTVPTGVVSNTAKIEWPAQTYGLARGDDSYLFSPVTFTEATIDDQVNVADTFNGITTPLGAGTVPPFDVGSSDTKTFTYKQTVPVPTYGPCVSYNNEAEFTTNTTGTKGKDSETVSVCSEGGARTMGFWQGPNGQSVITGSAATAGACDVGTYLRSLLGKSTSTSVARVYGDLTVNSNCAAVATYVNGVIRSANAGNASMAAMLRAQMLATALDVYFTDPANWTLANAGRFLNNEKLGDRQVDLTKICSVGTSNCSIDARAAFGGTSPQKVSDLITYAAGQYTSMTNWYAATGGLTIAQLQSRAKDTFDTINNNLAK